MSIYGDRKMLIINTEMTRKMATLYVAVCSRRYWSSLWVFSSVRRDPLLSSLSDEEFLSPFSPRRWEPSLFLQISVRFFSLTFCGTSVLANSLPLVCVCVVSNFLYPSPTPWYFFVLFPYTSPVFYGLRVHASLRSKTLVYRVTPCHFHWFS